MNGITQSTALWYASRATGVVSLVLLSIVMIIGVLVNARGRLPGLPSFAVTGLHRSLSLMSAAFITVHVLTAVIDPYVSIRLAAILIPFTSAYLPFWLGLGAVALDLMLALIITSLARARMPRRLWRGVHWLAYLAWPVASVHGLGASPDLRGGGLRDLALGCALAVGGAVVWRLSRAVRATPRAERAAGTLARSRRIPQPPAGGAHRAAGYPAPSAHRPGKVPSR